jgi:broad specificity phosphatase PhoE
MTSINIFWIRHGLSCANIHNITHALYFDPKLTQDGLNCSETSSRFVPNIKYDFIFCSVLKRAMETALSMFNSQPNRIISLPYIGEKGFGSDNKKSKYDKLSKYFINVSDKLDLDFHKNKHLGLDKVDLKKFFIFLKDYLEQVYENEEFPTNLNIAIVTHSHFMKHYNICATKNGENIKPHNNSIFKIIYNIDPKDENWPEVMFEKHKSQNIAEKIYHGCTFDKDQSNEIVCEKPDEGCKKKQTETSSKSIRCKKITEYQRPNTLKSLNEQSTVGGSRKQKYKKKTKRKYNKKLKRKNKRTNKRKS